jgi:hypothetical protein
MTATLDHTVTFKAPWDIFAQDVIIPSGARGKLVSRFPEGAWVLMQTTYPTLEEWDNCVFIDQEVLDLEKQTIEDVIENTAV